MPSNIIDKLKRWRADTPGCKNRLHFNNAGASLMPKPVMSVMEKHLHLEGEIGGYEAAVLKADTIDRFYSSMASFIHTQPKNIAYTYNATDSFARALSSIPFKKGDVIATSNNDYISNQIAFLALQKRIGIVIKRIPDLASGGVDVDAAEKIIKTQNPKIVAITHIPTGSGLVQDIQNIGKLCNQSRSLYLVDACQSIGQLALSVDEIKCDFMSGSYRKFMRGPRGAGFLYISDRVLEDGLEPLSIDMRGADWIQKDTYLQQATARRFEHWEFPYILTLGSLACIEYAQEINIHQIEERTTMLAKTLRDKLTTIDEVKLLDIGQTLCGIVTFWVQGKQPDELFNALSARKINTSLSYKVYNQIDYSGKGVDWALRASPHYFNTDQEINLFVSSLKEIIS